ncbi:MAG TPA: hypothetical protein PK331_12220 [Gordonia sp. (in: high G+C Gram-positive bacteria)]|uniref:sacsin N-terminal ATP-binding-like domain-containing protein n=1 Tax=unclassified Gordonia (in: high G+C Gram-positive bacteria) TaxID=2657482 RepID=UPI0025B9893D|nr:MULTISPECIES: hypothetical protein [unclassified Gordonia (in: high G+C Gram-positive bacteria)]HNP57284.1 hypothetical protein [Gordonia sp. (in: high G+C Gram-positive bacteria)]HRC51670.1 hypothetical protein [Gordonia sp. (in: high G+C Gram-positive bacteria)]
MTDPDPFGVASRRAAVLDAWHGSPTRLIEDSRAEADLAAVGYRDRLFTELAANAADAAVAAGVSGHLAVWRDADGALHVANTGEPLTADGVASLLALRVSAKERDDETVGRFGVGFAAVVPVADRVEIRSSTTALVFDRTQTEDAIVSARIVPSDEPVPLLRLAWLSDEAPATEFDTEIVLVPRAGIDVDDLLEGIAEQVCDRLLELPALAQITVGDVAVTAVRGDGEIRFEPVDSPIPGARNVWREAITGDVRWLGLDTKVGGRVAATEERLYRDPETLRTPTPTDIEISVPARVIAPLPVTPDRRHLMPGVNVGTLAPGYIALVRAFSPAQRPGFVPRALPRNSVDARLLESIGEELATNAWVPAADGGDDLAPRHTLVVADLSDALAACLGPVLAQLAHPDVSGPQQRAALLAVGAREIGLADIAEAAGDLDRPAAWWAQLYEALAPLVVSGTDAEELGALPVPRVDGRRNLGARGLVIAPAGVAAPWAPTVHPDAVHPLLERLGAQSVGAGELLAHDDLVAALADAAEHGTDDEVADLADSVLALLAADPEAVLSAEASRELLLPDVDGEPVHVDELLLADSPLAAILADDLPFAIVDEQLAERFGGDVLRRAGVGWGFLTVAEQWPTAPDHDLHDEERWWAGLSEQPPSMTAVRDLDLVPDDRWSDALALMANDPATALLLADRAGYTAWWLREHARINGREVRSYRRPDAEVLAGIVDPLDHPDAAALGGILVDDVVADVATAALILTNLGDADRPILPGAVVRGYGEVVAAIARGDVDVHELDVLLSGVPAARALDGSVIDDGTGRDAVVIDASQYLSVVAADLAVVAGLPVTADAARELADVLDLPLASDALTARVVSTGRTTTWDADADALRFAAGHGGDQPRGEVVVHDGLLVATDSGEYRVNRWVDANGAVHVDVLGYGGRHAD